MHVDIVYVYVHNNIYKHRGENQKTFNLEPIE
jgi:hypothetical protein